MEYKNSKSYGKRPIWLWVLIYIVIAVIAYALIYYFFIAKSTQSSYNAPVSQNTNNVVPPTTQDTVPVAKTAKINNGANGQYLTDGNGFSLYFFTKDTAGKSNCAGACINIWPASYNKDIVIDSPLQKTDFTTIIGNNGQKQLAYKGQPLYYYAKDLKPGDILGNGIGGVWFLAKP